MGGSRGRGACGPEVWKKHPLGCCFERRHRNSDHCQGRWSGLSKPGRRQSKASWQPGPAVQSPRCDDWRLPALSRSRPGNGCGTCACLPLRVTDLASQRPAALHSRTPFKSPRPHSWNGYSGLAWPTALHPGRPPRSLCPDRPDHASQSRGAGRCNRFSYHRRIYPNPDQRYL